ncbi:MAG: glucose-1-phosphate cytidylyltransferase [Herpetosiphonaceae bacterium]|nr:glucose-1-phosphate cytidylyltransferase [Herpetosiphonaceae bacterium]
MKVVILVGGRGTRLGEETVVKPKPMVEIGGKPILWHIMQIYAAHHFQEFVLALGYKGAIIKDYFLNFYSLNNDLSVDLRTGAVEVHQQHREDWHVHLVDTGDQTLTGGRLKRLREWVGNETFMMTYGDGVADINLNDLLAFHREQGRLATVTAVRPPARFGELDLHDGTVVHVAEKPQTDLGWINGGFFVLEPAVLEYIADDQAVWEREPMEALARQGQLVAYQHHGFWQCMDTVRDVRLLEELWSSDDVPWKVWP